MSVARTARARVHEEVSAEILAVARTHLARDGAAGLSLRSVARDLGLAPSALYRYYPGRDALLSALILSAYGSLADEAERASAAAYAATGGDAERWSLIVGTPVPGYEAPPDTVVPYARLAAALLRPVLDAKAEGRQQPAGTPPALSETLRAAVAPVAEAFPGLPEAQVVLALQAWTTLIGAISLELFGHWRNTVLAPEEFYEDTIRRMAATIGLDRVLE
jgi:AcrR family transcriptional regulator